MTYYDKSASQTVDLLCSNTKSGLTSNEANRRLKLNGLNQLNEAASKSLFSRLIDQLKDAMVLILIVAAIISFLLAIFGDGDFLEPIVIILIVILNAVLGVMQEYKAEKALSSLKKLTASTTKVLRDSLVSIIDSHQLVVGDIVLFEAGDYISADCRLIEAFNFQVDESSLTGESIAASKNSNTILKSNALLGDRINSVFSGSLITYGRARAIVTATGMNTTIGAVATLLNQTGNTHTPLQNKLSQLGKYLGYISLIICAIIFIIGIINGQKINEIFMTSVSLAVAAIPEGLPAIVTIVLALGVSGMARSNAIVRTLPAVETLGSATVICSDKTGTLTLNNMKVQQCYDNTQICDIAHHYNTGLLNLLTYATLCTDVIINGDDNKISYIGDATEVAIAEAAYSKGIDKRLLKGERVNEIPFDSNRKLMTTVYKIDGKLISITKGAFDVLITKCNNANDNAYAVNKQMSVNGLRVIAVAIKQTDISDSLNLESNLTFVGLISMLDPPRPQAFQAVRDAQQAGIRVVMITGDHIETAISIARKLNILKLNSQAISGQQLEHMSEAELKKKVYDYTVYARVSPSDKLRIVTAFQANGEVVAMTGDGVNDAPALKASDIGCSMGLSGTEVAKNASDMILTDDNFATIVSAVKVGRGLYDNILKSIQFLLGSNIGEVLTVFIAMLIWKQSSLVAMQLLWINLVTDSLPAIALGLEPVEDDIMLKNPRNRNEGVFANGMGFKIIVHGMIIAAVGLFSFLIGWKMTSSVEAGQTMAFIVLALSQLLYGLCVRSKKSLFAIGIFTNKYLIGALAVSVGMVLLVVFTPLATLFNLVVLPTSLYVLAMVMSLIPLIIVELFKLINSFIIDARCKATRLDC